MNKIVTSISLGTLLALSAPVAAQGGFDPSSVYVGGGLSENAVSGYDNAVGFQLFGGYRLPYQVGPVDTAVEVGYFHSGSFERHWLGGDKISASGVWVTAVGSWTVIERLDVIGRAGLDFGDDDGILVGGGVNYSLQPNLDVRGELVLRDNIRSVQANLVYRP